MLVDKDNALGQRYFCITFNYKKNTYFLKDMEDGSGTFVKVVGREVLREQNIVSFGDCSFVVSFVGGVNLGVHFREGAKAGKD